jgi:hypothetical protein
MSGLAEITSSAAEYVMYIPVALGGVAILVSAVILAPRADKALKRTLNELQEDYHDSLGREELVKMYRKARRINCRALGKRKGEADDLVRMLEAQLGPIIKDEITASLEKGVTPNTTLERLSETYTQTYARYKG